MADNQGNEHVFANVQIVQATQPRSRPSTDSGVVFREPLADIFEPETRLRNTDRDSESSFEHIEEVDAHRASQIEFEDNDWHPVSQSQSWFSRHYSRNRKCCLTCVFVAAVVIFLLFIVVSTFLIFQFSFTSAEKNVSFYVSSWWQL